MKSLLARALPLALGLGLLAPVASADPVVRPGGLPGVATGWESSGKVVTLTIDGDFDAEAVAAAILESVKGAQAKADGQQVVVTGVDEAALLAALEKIDVSGGGDDVDAMLSALQNPGGEEDGSGSSIRAGKKVDFDAVKGPPGHLVTGKVVKVKRGRYPLVLVSVRVAKAPKSGKGPARGTTVRVLPYVKSTDGVVDPTHAQSQLNVGAWYARPGDRVKLRLEPTKRDGVWIAKAFERVK